MIKNAIEIEKMRIAGNLASKVLVMIGEHVKPGISTEELDDICHSYIVKDLDCIPAPLNYRGFPKSICTSVNHVICHGIPGSKKLKNGDCLNIDITVIKNGYHGDTSRMFHVGEPSIQSKRLATLTYECMWAGIGKIKAGAHLGDIGAVIQNMAESAGFSVVREFCGHGIGSTFHEDPQVVHYGTAGSGLQLEAGMIFTVEPMINAGKREIRMLSDGWTVVTKDHQLSAQWEHTILVTDTGYDVLTVSDGTPPPPNGLSFTS